MQRIASPILVLEALVVVTLVFLSVAGCMPLAAWTAEGYTEDASRSAQATSIVGHCFRLLMDSETVRTDQRIALHDGSSVGVYGRVHVITPSSGSTSPHGPFSLPKGSRIVVERVLLSRNVEMSYRTPYIRIDGQLIDAGELFRDTGKGEGPFRLTNIDRLLEPCDGK